MYQVTEGLKAPLMRNKRRISKSTKIKIEEENEVEEKEGREEKESPQTRLSHKHLQQQQIHKWFSTRTEFAEVGNRTPLSVEPC